MLDGGTGIDFATFFLSPNPVTVDLGAGSAKGEGSDRMRAVEGVWGSPQNDTIVGSNRRDFVFLDGGANNVQLLGGNDVVWPGPGNDAVNGGPGQDLVSYEPATSPVTIDLGAGSATGYGTDSLTGIEDAAGGRRGDTITGGGGPNRLYGLAGADTIFGGAGDDELYGGAGADHLDGGDGFDLCRGGATTVNCEDEGFSAAAVISARLLPVRAGAGMPGHLRYRRP